MEEKSRCPRRLPPAARFGSFGLRPIASGKEALGSLQDAGNPDEDDSANKGNDDRADHSPGTPGRQNSQSAEQPAAKPATDNAEKDVHDNAVATALHDESGEPASDKTNDEPIDHVVPPLLRCGPEG